MTLLLESFWNSNSFWTIKVCSSLPTQVEASMSKKTWMNLELAYDMNWLRGRPQFYFLFQTGKRIFLLFRIALDHFFFWLGVKMKKGKQIEWAFQIKCVMSRKLKWIDAFASATGPWIAMKNCLEKFVDIKNTLNFACFSCFFLWPKLKTKKNQQKLKFFSSCFIRVCCDLIFAYFNDDLFLLWHFLSHEKTIFFLSFLSCSF